MSKYGFSIHQDLALALCIEKYGTCPYGCVKDGAPNCDAHVRNIGLAEGAQCEPGKLTASAALDAERAEEQRKAKASRRAKRSNRTSEPKPAAIGAPVSEGSRRGALIHEINELDGIIDNCVSILNATTKIKNAIKTGDIETIREGLKVINDHVERRSHRIVIGTEPGNVYALLEELEAERECELAKEAAREAGVNPDYEAAWEAHANNLAALDPAYEQYEIAREALAG